VVLDGEKHRIDRQETAQMPAHSSFERTVVQYPTNIQPSGQSTTATYRLGVDIGEFSQRHHRKVARQKNFNQHSDPPVIMD
jgi:hypothetical protein